MFKLLINYVNVAIITFPVKIFPFRPGIKKHPWNVDHECPTILQGLNTFPNRFKSSHPRHIWRWSGTFFSHSLYTHEQLLTFYCPPILRIPLTTNVPYFYVKQKMLGNSRKTWIGGSVWSIPFCLATSLKNNSKTTITLSAPNPLFWFCNDTWMN